MTKPPTTRQPQGSAPGAPPSSHGVTSTEVLTHALNPFAQLVGHSLAAAIGFVLMALVGLIPIAALKLLELAGAEHLKDVMEKSEYVLLYTDAFLSGVVFLAGALLFLTEVYVSFERRIIATWKRRKAP